MKSRKRLGAALHISSSSGNLILEAENEVRIGESVFDESGRRVGTVFDLFGPVSRSFVAVKPRIMDPESLLDEALFLGGRNR